MKNVSSVFWYALSICAVLVTWGAIAPTHLQAVSSNVTKHISETFGWYYLLIILI